MNYNMIFSKSVLAAVAMAATLTACSSDDDTVNNDENGSVSSAFIFSATNSEGNANYIATVGSLDEGESSVLNNGFETFTATEWFTYKNKYLFRLQYNQGNAGGTSAYFLNSKGEIEQTDYTFDIQRFTTYGVYGDYVMTAAAAASSKVDAKGNAAYGISVTYLDAEKGTTRNRDMIMSENFLGTGEYVTLSGMVEANGKLYSAVVPLGLSAYGSEVENGKYIKAGNEDLLAVAESGARTLSTTQYPDSSFVVIYDNEKMENPTIIRTNKMSYASGRMRSQFYQTIWAAENGDIYVFSPSYARLQTDARLKSTHTSKVMRIKAGATEFDETYGAVDLESKAGMPLFRCWSMSEDYFLCQFYGAGINTMGTGANVLGIYQGSTKEFKTIQGLPSTDVITSYSKRPYTENGLTYIAVQTNDGQKPAVYSIDPKTGIAKRGIEIECGTISYTGKLFAVK